MRITRSIRGDWELHAEQSRYFGTPHRVPGLDSALEGCCGTFVEVGCGDGNRLENLTSRRLLEPFERVLAFDASRERVERCRRLTLRAQIDTGDACALALPDDSVDFLFSDQVIEHVPDDRAMASEIARVLRPGGKAVVGSVAKAKWAWYFYRNDGRWVLDPTHVREYAGADAYREVFESVGLQVDGCTSGVVQFPLAGIGLRTLMRWRLLNGAAAERSGRSRLFRELSRVSVPLPGYRLIWAFLRKDDRSRV